MSKDDFFDIVSDFYDGLEYLDKSDGTIELFLSSTSPVGYHDTMRVVFNKENDSIDVFTANKEALSKSLQSIKTELDIRDSWSL